MNAYLVNLIQKLANNLGYDIQQLSLTDSDLSDAEIISKEIGRAHV